MTTLINKRAFLSPSGTDAISIRAVEVEGDDSLDASLEIHSGTSTVIVGDYIFSGQEAVELLQALDVLIIGASELHKVVLDYTKQKYPEVIKEAPEEKTE